MLPSFKDVPLPCLTVDLLQSAVWERKGMLALVRYLTVSWYSAAQNDCVIIIFD